MGGEVTGLRVGPGQRGYSSQAWGRVATPCPATACTPPCTQSHFALRLTHLTLRANSYPKVTVPKKC
jgi:hypothetical protein